MVITNETRQCVQKKIEFSIEAQKKEWETTNRRQQQQRHEKKETEIIETGNINNITIMCTRPTVYYCSIIPPAFTHTHTSAYVHVWIKYRHSRNLSRLVCRVLSLFESFIHTFTLWQGTGKTKKRVTEKQNKSNNTHITKNRLEWRDHKECEPSKKNERAIETERKTHGLSSAANLWCF